MNRQLFTWLALLSLGCEPTPPRLRVEVEEAPGLAELARMRVVVRRCGDEQLAYAADLDGSAVVGAAVRPGEAFYVWLQGWAQCPPADRCVAPAEATADDQCRCDTGQRLQAEGCTPWLRMSDDTEQVSLVLGRTSEACPPKPVACESI